MRGHKIGFAEFTKETAFLGETSEPPMPTVEGGNLT
jgi:hypothetical protein